MYQQVLRHLLLLCLTLLAGNLSAEPLLGTPAPDFQGRDLAGHPHRLSDYAGKIVVLEWSSPECPYSRRYYENGTLDALVKYAAEKDIVWINIVPRLHKLTREQALQHLDPTKKLILLDTGLDISTLYGATTTPEIFIIDQQGLLAYSGAIDSSASLKKTTGKVVPYTRNALDDLLAGLEVGRMITRAFGCMVKNKVQVSGDLPQIIPTGSR